MIAIKPKEFKDFIHKTDGTKVYVSPDAKTYSLEELQRVVGGYIEIVRLTAEVMMIVNEEGKVNGLPVNENATKLLRTCLLTDDFIVGDALVCDAHHID